MMKEHFMTEELLARLNEEEESRPVAVLSGLWRKAHLRAPEGRERRHEIRIPTDESARISIPGPERIEKVDIRIVDVSRGGLRVLVNRCLRQGSMVMVHLRNADVMAEVRYCRPADAPDHHIGLQVRFVV